MPANTTLRSVVSGVLALADGISKCYKGFFNVPKTKSYKVD